MRFPYKANSFKNVQKNFDFLATKLGASSGGGIQPVVSNLFTVSGVSNIALGAVDGENITGVRLTGFGTTALSGGGTGAGIYLRINGVNINAGYLLQRAWKDAVPNFFNDSQGINTAPGQSGLLIGSSGWAVTANAVGFNGTLFTKVINRRHWLGSYFYQDIAVDANKILHTDIVAFWHDLATPVTSLDILLVPNAGTVTFTGRVLMEILP